MDPANRATKLRTLINDYRYNYHVLDKSIMSEAAADSLKRELSQIETKHPELITVDSPTQRVAGQALPGFKKVQHSQRMLSLNDVFNETEINNWEDRVNKLLPSKLRLDYFLDIKMDGLACALVYEDGILVQAITRGDGYVGEDVTVNIRTIESIPLELRYCPKYKQFLSGRTEIRGEIVMYKKDFDKLNKEQKDKGLALFANPRNLAAGTIRQLDPKLVAKRSLQYHAYDLLRQNTNDVPTYCYAYQAMRELGLKTNVHAKVVSTIKDVIKYANLWKKNVKLCRLIPMVW